MESLPAGKTKLDHIGIAVRDLGAAAQAYEALGLSATHREVIADQGVEVLVIASLPQAGEAIPLGRTRIELLMPLGEDTPVGRFIAKRGEGMHHLALEVPDIRAALKRCKAEGMRLIDEEPKPGAEGRLIAFIHPQSTGGVLIELTEKNEPQRHKDTEI